MSRDFKWTLIILGALVLLPLYFPYLLIAVPLAAVVGGTKLYRQWSGTGATSGGAALAFGLASHACMIILTMLQFLLIPAGSSGRPMMLTAFYFLFGLVMTPLGVGKALRARPQEKSLATSALVVSLAILPVALLTLFALATATAFELEP